MIGIKHIKFGVLSADQIRSMSVCKIDGLNRTGPGSVYDPRLGYTLDSDKPCPTCNEQKKCVGHFGHIELSVPIIHPYPIFHKMVALYLSCFCKVCSRLLVSEEQLEFDGILRLQKEKRFKKILEKLEKIDTCLYCKSPQPNVIFKSKEGIIVYEYKKKKEKTTYTVSVEDIVAIFDKIVDSDIVILGFDPEYVRPKNYILTVFPVIPVCARPPVMAETICDDDLTYQLSEICKVNNNIASTKDATDKEKFIRSLKFRISTFYSNAKGKAKHPTDNRPLKCLKERLSGKEGIVRSNLMGKRVDFSARTVIGSDPNLELDEVAVPPEIAKIESFPETVNDFNRAYLQDLVDSGKANMIIKKDGTKKHLQYLSIKRGTELFYGDVIFRRFTPSEELLNCVEIKKRGGDEKNDENDKLFRELSQNKTIIFVFDSYQTLQNGDRLYRNGNIIKEISYPEKKKINIENGEIVRRQLRDGDLMLFNRQPTLHRGSMLAKRIRVLPGKSFRFNLPSCKSFNADFDGDEMNGFYPQSYRAKAELQELVSTKKHIISPQESKPIIGIVQDTLIGAYLMTSRIFCIQKFDFFDLTMKGKIKDREGNISDVWNPEKFKTIEKIFKKHKKPVGKYLYSGKALFSMLLPNDLYYEKENKANEKEPVVRIEKGVMYEGTLDKNILGLTHNSLIQILNKEYGDNVCANFIDNLCFIIHDWLLLHGFSVGIKDCITTSEQSQITIRDTLTKCYIEAEGIEQTTQNAGIREVRVTATLSKAKDIGMKIAKESMTKDNAFKTTVGSGAKGDFFNIAQITGLLGQQNINNQRIVPLLNHGKRSLPHYPLDGMSKEQEYESRGFISHSFIQGLNPREFIFHAMAGREGICNTGLSTADSGYLQRKIVKSFEDIQVRQDGTVRDAMGKIYQTGYGGTCIDPMLAVKAQNTGDLTFIDIGRLAMKLNSAHEEKQAKETKPEKVKKNKK